MLLSMVLYSGCMATTTNRNFYGIGIKNSQYAEDFKIKSTAEGVSYSYNKSTMNPDICAWGSQEYGRLRIRVTNKSNMPIATNYFSDDFSLISKDGKLFKLKKCDILSYPNLEYINPDQTVTYRLINPYDYPNREEKLKQNTAMIICELGSHFDRVIIVLKPLPKPQENRM